MWVDFDAVGQTLGDIDFPWDNGSNMNLVVDNLHVYSNDARAYQVCHLEIWAEPVLSE